MATEYPYVDTRLGSQLFLFPRSAIRGTYGSDDLEAVLVNKFFDTAVTGAVVTAQAAQGVGAAGAEAAEGVAMDHRT